MEKPHFNETNVHIARRLATGMATGMPPPQVTNINQSPTRLLQDSRQDGNLNQRLRISLTQQELSQTREEQVPYY
jgi:hypothetical protein